jgi:hypothetical protein
MTSSLAVACAGAGLPKEMAAGNADYTLLPCLADGTWEDLPATVCPHLISLLSAKDCASLQLSCTSWYSKLGPAVAELCPKVLAADKLTERFPNITSLDLSQCSKYSESSLLPLFKLCKLAKIKLSNSENYLRSSLQFPGRLGASGALVCALCDALTWPCARRLPGAVEAAPPHPSGAGAVLGSHPRGHVPPHRADGPQQPVPALELRSRRGLPGHPHIPPAEAPAAGWHGSGRCGPHEGAPPACPVLPNSHAASRTDVCWGVHSPHAWHPVGLACTHRVLALSHLGVSSQSFGRGSVQWTGCQG